MPVFVYDGKARNGKTVKGEYSADTREEVFSYLRQKGIIASNVRKKGRTISFKIGTGVTIDDVTNFARQFSAMTNAGI